MSTAGQLPYDVHLPYEGEACLEFVLSRLIEPLTAAGYRAYTTKYYVPGQPLLDEFMKGVEQSRLTVLPLCHTFMNSQYYWYVENAIHDRKVIREGSAIFVKMEEDCFLSQKLRPFGFLDFTTDAAYKEEFPRLLRTLGPPPSAHAPAPDDTDDYDDVFPSSDPVDDQTPGTNFVHALHRGFDAMGPQINKDLVDPEKARLTACKEFQWCEWSLRAFCHDPDSYIQRVQKITPPLRDNVEKVLMLGILPVQQSHRGSCITLAKLSCCGLPRVEEQALEALLNIIYENMFHQGTGYPESSGLSDVTREVLYILSNKEALRQWSRGTALLRIHVCCILLLCLHVAYVHGDIGLEFSAEELKKTQAVIRRKFETFDSTDLSFRCLGDYYMHLISEASKRIANKSIGKFKELLTQTRLTVSRNDNEATKQLVKDIYKAEEYDQHIVLSHLADMAFDSEAALGMFQRAVYKLTQTCNGSRADRLFILIAELFVRILQTTKRSDLCCLALRPRPPTNGKRKKRLGLAELWYEQEFHRGNAQHAVEVLCRPLLHHPQPDVRETMARRLVMRQGGGEGDIEWDDLIPIEAKHISDQYKMLGLRIVTHQATPCQDLEGHVVWKGTTTHGPVAIKVYKVTSIQELMRDGEMSEDARIARNNVRMLGELNGCPNILQLLGFQLRPQPVYHITESMEEGNLLEFLLRKRKDHQHTRSSLLYLRGLITILLDMVTALRFCHDNSIVHRDVMARNFFVYRKSGTYRCKLGNFNMAAKAPTLEEQTYECPDCLQIVFQGSSEDKVAKLWSAPESMVGYQFSDKSDVWMLGCAMYEVLTHGCRPYTEMYGMAADDIVQQVVFGLRPRQPSCVPGKLFRTAMLPCFLTDPAERIGLVQLERKLKSYQRECPLPGVEHIDDIHPPPRLSPHQSTRPERGIPKNLETQLSSETELSPIGYRTEKEKFPCQASEILAYDQPNGNGKEFLRETRIDTQRRHTLQRLDHVNIRRVIDIVLNGDQVTQISQVFSRNYVPLLAAARDKRLSLDGMLWCLKQVADAMAFAHGQTLVKGEGIIHCDLRAMYVIWNGQQVKVGRWGRASRLRLGLYDTRLSESVVTKPMPPDSLRWSPMEVIESGIYSQGSDIFTFGQLCWEVFHAYNADKGSQNRVLAPYPDLYASEVLPYLQRRQRLLQPCHCPDWLYRLMKLCWLDERSRRPGFDKISDCFSSPHSSPLLDIGDSNTYKQQAPGGNEESLNAALNHQDRHYFRQGLLQNNTDPNQMFIISLWDFDNVSRSSVDTFATATSEDSHQTDGTISSDLTSGTWQSAESRSLAGTVSSRLTASTRSSRRSTRTEDLLNVVTYTCGQQLATAVTPDVQSMILDAETPMGYCRRESEYHNAATMAPVVDELTSKLQDARLTTSNTFDDPDKNRNASEVVVVDEAQEASEVKICRNTSFLNPSYEYNAPRRFNEKNRETDRPDYPANFPVTGEGSSNPGNNTGGEREADPYTKLANPTSSSNALRVPSLHHTNQWPPPVPPRPLSKTLSQFERNMDGMSAESSPRADSPPPPLLPRGVSAMDVYTQDDPPYADVLVPKRNHAASTPINITRPLSMLHVYPMPHSESSPDFTSWEQESIDTPPSTPGEDRKIPRAYSDTSLPSRGSCTWYLDGSSEPFNDVVNGNTSDTSLPSQASSYPGRSQESLSTSRKPSKRKRVRGLLKNIKSSFRKKSDRAKSTAQDDIPNEVAGASQSDRTGHASQHSEEAVVEIVGRTSSACNDCGDSIIDTDSDDEEHDTRL